MTRSTSRVALTLGLLSIAVAAALGASRVFEPFYGDQALFLTGASSLHAGGVLYRDFWDIKQPGIFAFFFAGASLFGLTQTGEHVAELVWQTAFAVVLFAGLRDAFEDSRWAAVAPVAVVATYFAGSPLWYLLQVEGLVGLPIFACAWFALAAMRDARRRASYAACSGVAAGVVVVFKLLLFIVPLGVALAIVVASGAKVTRGVHFRTTFAWIAGCCLPVAACVLYAFSHGIAGEFFATTFLVPIQIARAFGHAPFSRLEESAKQFLHTYGALVVLGAIGFAFVRDERSRPWRTVCLVWIACAAVALVVQTQSWWEYHFLVFVAPFGIAATFGLRFLYVAIVDRTSYRFTAIAVLCVVALSTFSPVRAALGNVALIARDRPFTSDTALERYRTTRSGEYRANEDDVAYLDRANVPPGPLYVFGDPLIYTIARREQAIAVNGWALELYTQAIWQRLDDELAAARPSAVFVADSYARDTLPKQSPQTLALLARRYARTERTASGTWYRLRPGIASR